MKRIKVLVIDDSSTMRAVIKAVLKTDPTIEVVGEAADPYEGREAIKALNPDVITLDIEMPRMTGLQFLKKIMELRPMPVIMVSTLTQKGAEDSIEALQLGAFECVGKPASGDFIKELSHLPEIVKAAAKYKPRNKTSVPQSAPTNNFRPNSNIISIGSSTGGVEALFNILSGFPENCPPTIVTQHMPESFLVSFTERLNRTILPSVAVATDKAPLKKGHVYFAPGGLYHLEIYGSTTPICHLLASEPVSSHRPSVDVMFRSVAKSLGSRAVGMILTGMGRDGADGLLSIRQAGGRTLGQDKTSSVVYGMARVASEIGAVEKELDIGSLAQEALKLCTRNS